MYGITYQLIVYRLVLICKIDKYLVKAGYT